MELPVLVKSAFKYTSANLLNAMIPILLLPVLTSYLSKDDYGLLSMFQVTTMFLLPFIGFNSAPAIERGYYDEKVHFPDYVNSGYCLILINGVAVLFLVVISRESLESFAGFPATFMWTIPVYCVFQNIGEIMLSYWRLKNRASMFGLFRIGRTCLELILSIILVMSFSRGWLGRLDALLVSAGSFAILASVYLFKGGMLKVSVRKDYVKGIINFGLPLVPHVIGGVILVYSDRLFITKLVGIEETGSYTVGYQVAMAISLLQSSFNLAWVPWFYGKLQENDPHTKLRIVKFTYLYNVLILCSAIALTLASPIIFSYFININYHDSIKYVFWIAIAFAFDGMYKMVVNYIFYVRKTYIISVITFATAIINLILNYVLIKRFGAIGAAKATALCLLLEYLAVWVISSRLYNMPWLFFLSRHECKKNK